MLCFEIERILVVVNAKGKTTTYLHIIYTRINLRDAQFLEKDKKINWWILNNWGFRVSNYEETL